MLEIRNGEFFWHSKSLIPFIVEEGLDSNVCHILLPASLNDDLDWKEPLEKAKIAAEKGKLLFWEFDFQISSLKEQSSFHSYALCIDHFKEKVWKFFEKETLAVCLYRGPFQIALDLQEKELFQEWLLDAHPSHDKNHLENLYSTTRLGEYLHRLASCLPDEILPFCLFDVSSLTSRAQALQLFSKERFAHLQLGLQGAKIPMSALSWEKGAAFGGWIGSGEMLSFPKECISHAVVLPSDKLCAKETLKALDQLFLDLKKLDIPFKVISELYLTEEWEGIDFLFVQKSSLSALGKRKLQGFCAAGGEVVSLEDRIGLTNESLYTEWEENNRSRGIRTPDPLLPKQLR